MLKIFAKLVKDSQNKSKYVNLITNLFELKFDDSLRDATIDCLKNLDYFEEKALNLLKNLNSSDKKALDKTARNVDLAISACFEFNNELHKVSLWKFKEIQLILINFFSFFEEDDVSLRMAAITSFTIAFEKYNDNSIEYNYFIKNKFLPILWKFIKRNSTNPLREFSLKSGINLLQSYLKFHGKNFAGEEKNYCLDLINLNHPHDPSQNFFENILDIQLGKRIKAVLFLSKFITKNSSEISFASLKKIILPILKYHIFFIEQSKDSGFKKASINNVKKLSNKNSLIEACIECYSNICCKLASFQEIQKILKGFINKLSKEKKYDKAQVKLICTLLDFFNSSKEFIDISNLMKENEKKEENFEILKNCFLENKDKVFKSDLNYNYGVERQLMKMDLEDKNINQQKVKFLINQLLVPLKRLFIFFQIKKKKNLNSKLKII